MSGLALAIVGRGCILPGARTPAELWEGVLAGRVWIGEAPGGPTLPGAPFSQVGGYVADEGGDDGEDPLTRWTFAAARAALAEAGLADPSGRPRAGAVFGHLSLPSRTFARFAESVWLQGPGPAAESRFMSGLPIQRVARALGLDAGALALDAACASSLYAIKIARDWLEDGRADVVLAGGVSGADPLFLHHGFHALRASSPSGRSRPFHQQADGLVPAEGAACVALKRLADAERAGDRILGVIRGIGLTNDGGGQALLAPSRSGQVAAMREAYADAGTDPATVQLVECHATGTPVGDAAEVDSMREVFAGSPGLVVSSLKANTGHLLTASGAAGLLKVLAAMEAGIFPPTPGVDAPLAGLDGQPLRVLHRPAPWPDAGPRRAAISAFGFGGNNAHVVVEQWLPPRAAAGARVVLGSAATAPQPAAESLAGPGAPTDAAQQAPSRSLAEIAVVGIGCVAGPHGSRAEFERALFREPTASPAPAETVSVRSEGLRFPPNDLAQALPQQLAILQAAQEAVADAGRLPPARTSVLVGMQCDPEIARHVTWLRLPEAAASGDGPLTAPAVVGLLPNVPANRLNNLWNLAGPSFTVSAEELSGIAALELATRALRAGEVDAALVGAVDMCCEPVHAAAAAAVLAGPRAQPGDAAAVLVLKRLEDARRDGSPVYAVVRDEGHADLEIGLDDLAPRFGHAHAASGLLHVAAAALACSRGALPDGSSTPWLPAGGPRRAAVGGAALGGMSARVVLEEPERNLPAAAAGPRPRLHVYAAADAAELARALAEGRDGGTGEARAVLVAAGASEVARGRDRALKIVREGTSAADEDGVHVRLRPLSGQLALVFTGAATAYAGMGREQLLAFPDLLTGASARLGSPRAAAGWIYRGGAADPLGKLAGSSLLCQVHADLTLRVLGLRPDAALGLSSGETNALVALGAWRDVGGLFDDLRREGLYDRELGGELRALRRAWCVRAEDPLSWRAWRVLRPVAEVRAALAGEPRVALTTIHTERDCVIGGEVEACARVLRRLGGGAAVALDYDFAVHCPEVAEVAATWRAIHRRPTVAVPGVRFYGAAGGAGPVRDADQVADALLGMAAATVDWPAMVRRAWDDGVRVFVEHGPRGLCSGWIGEILAGRPHLAVALDRPGRDGVRQAAEAVAALVAAGVACDWQAFNGRLAAGEPAPAGAERPVLRFPAHPPRVDLSASTGTAGYEVMAPAPDVDFMRPVDGWAAAAPEPEILETAPVVGLAGGDDGRAPELGELPVADAPLPVRVGTDGDGMAAAPSGRPGAPLPAATAHDSRGMGAVADLTPGLDGGLGTPPPALAAHAGGPAVPLAGRASATPHGRLPRVAPVPPSPPGDPAVAAPVLVALMDHQRRLTEVHRGYIALQAEVHAKFMDLQRRAWARATAGMRPPGVAAPAPHNGAGTLAGLPAEAQPLHLPAPAPPTRPTAGGQRLAVPAPGPESGPDVPARPTTEAQPSAAAPVRAFSRQQLEQLARGRISDVFGPQHRFQDGFRRQVRLPLPPLLLPDRVVSLEGEPCSMGRGVIVTETDVPPDAWYAHDGYVTPGILVESGQSDLLLISWLGIDAHNRGERVYRLLGCELTFHGAPPRAGETLRYRIEVVGHARHGDVRLFFFRYDCTANGRPVLSVREGQAGFFSDEELAGSAGVLWDPATAEHRGDGPLDPPAIDCGRRSFDRDALDAFTDGRLADCFGPRFLRASTHVLPPRIPGGRLRLLDRVTELDPRGGPWGRGYLRAETDLRGDEWFFPCHFKDDPVMPGTLMAEGCVQAMAFYLSAMGFSLRRDGWRFEPEPEQPARMICRGQVLPSSRHMVYELFVEDVSSGPLPTLHADLLVTVDGLKVFHGRRMGVRLVPGWPLSGRRELLAGVDESRPVATVSGVRQDERALLACAWGAPTAAFGAPYRAFDAGRRLPRLPGPPYLFVSRVVRVTGSPGTATAGTEVEVEYDIPAGAWYFGAAGGGRMPYCVLMEAALQPCGWLTAHMGIPLASGQDLFFRNLDGRGTVHREVGPGDRTLRTRVRTTDVSRMGDTVIESFHVECRVGDEPVYTLDTVFGHFPAQALDQQVGLAPTPAEAGLMAAPANVDEPLQAPARAPLLMLDRLTGWWPERGRARAEKRVDAGEWFFKAHFFQDPVQPGSLGIEAMLQLLQAYMARSGQAGGHFEAIERDRPLVWKYRGQVLPEDGVVAVGLQVTESGADFARADGTLWVDGRLIYRATGLGMRVVPGDSSAVDRGLLPSTGWDRRAERSDLLTSGGLPGGVAARHDALPEVTDRGRAVAVKEHVARQAGIHPSAVRLLAADAAVASNLPLHRFPVAVEEVGGCVRVRDAGPPRLDVAGLRAAWRHIPHAVPGEDVFLALAERFVRRVELADPEAWAGLRLGGRVYLANHQTGIESALFCYLLGGLSGSPVVGLAKAEHRSTWLGGLARTLVGPEAMLLFERQDPASMLGLLADVRRHLVGGTSVLVHVDGTRSLRAGQPVTRVSATLIDAVLASEAPVVPVRFSGGLPRADAPERLEFPLGYGTQDYHIGAPILPRELASAALAERRDRILDAINRLGPRDEAPHAPDPDLGAEVEAWVAATGAARGDAVVRAALRRFSDPGPLTRRLLSGDAGQGAMGDLARRIGGRHG